jgi:predicted ArsR family transcriptional regulator
MSGCGEPVDRDQAAAAASISRSLAAYHLDRLVGVGLLTADYRRAVGRRGPGAGRPAKVYSRSQTEIAVTLPPREYELAARLLAEAVETDPTGSALAGLRHAARPLGTAIAATSTPAAARDARTGISIREVRVAHGLGFPPRAEGPSNR